MTLKYPVTTPKPRINPFEQIAKPERGLANLKREPATLLDDDPWTVAKFKYCPPGNYAIEIDGHCYLIYTGRAPGRYVQKDGQKIDLSFTHDATPSEIKEELWAEANGVRLWDQRSDGSEL